MDHWEPPDRTANPGEIHPGGDPGETFALLDGLIHLDGNFVRRFLYRP